VYRTYRVQVASIADHRQLAASDVIILNKLDLVTADQVDQVQRVVAGLNPTLRVYKTTKSQIDLKELFDLRAYTAAPALPPVSAENNACGHDHDHEHEHDHDHGGKQSETGVHNSGITTTLIPIPTLSADQYDALRDFLEILLWKGTVPTAEGYAPEILRCKGLIRISGGQEVVLQGVTDIFELKELSGEAARNGAGGDAEEGGKVVFIGRRVDDRLGTALRRHIGVE